MTYCTVLWCQRKRRELLPRRSSVTLNGYEPEGTSLKGTSTSNSRKANFPDSVRKDHIHLIISKRV